MTTQSDPEGTETRFLLRYADLTGAASKHVLEVGCGDGRLTWRYARSVKRVVGIDLHADDLRVARIDRPADLAEQVTFIQGDAVHLPVARGSFDLAIFAWSF